MCDFSLEFRSYRSLAGLLSGYHQPMTTRNNSLHLDLPLDFARVKSFIQSRKETA
jgi:hypothetical protein